MRSSATVERPLLSPLCGGWALSSSRSRNIGDWSPGWWCSYLSGRKKKTAIPVRPRAARPWPSESRNSKRSTLSIPPPRPFKARRGLPCASARVTPSRPSEFVCRRHPSGRRCRSATAISPAALAFTSRSAVHLELLLTHFIHSHIHALPIRPSPSERLLVFLCCIAAYESHPAVLVELQEPRAPLFAVKRSDAFSSPSSLKKIIPSVRSRGRPSVFPLMCALSYPLTVLDDQAQQRHTFSTTLYASRRCLLESPRLGLPEGGCREHDQPPARLTATSAAEETKLLTPYEVCMDDPPSE